MSPRDQIRPDRSRAFRAVPAAVEYEEESDRVVPDLLAKNPLKPPLTKRVKEIATLIGALGAITGYALGAGNWLIKQAGVAKVSDINAAVVPIVASQQASDKQRGDNAKAVADELAAIHAEQRAQATTLQAIQRSLRRMHAPKDLPQ